MGEAARPRRPLRRLVVGVVVLGGVAGAYVFVTFVQVWRAAGRDEARRVDAIVVFGAAQYNGRPSPVLRARLDHALALYRRDLADHIVVTGGRRVGDRFTEATASAAYLRRQGVPEQALLREVSGRNSWQSLAAAARFLRGHDPPLTKILLVSDGFHSARISAIAGELGLDAFTSPAPASPIRGASKLAHLTKETVVVATGRIVGFRRLAGIDERVAAARAPAANG